ncbi:MAG: SDR family oxidoreductase [Pseudomonadota bacterium]
MTKTLLCIGYGYSARALAPLLDGWTVIGTSRTPEKVAGLNVTGLVWPGTDLTPYLERATHVLMSASPFEHGDPVLADYALQTFDFDWVGYLSTTGVYGDHGGAWVDESTPLNPSTRRGQQRLAAEHAWRATGVPLHIFRLAGIYGPGRGPFSKVRNGTAKRIVKPDQVFSRIHVDDIAQVLAASIANSNPGAVYNVCDDDPAPPEDVIAFAAQLLKLPIPPAVPFDQADMSDMARSFYAENKRVRNDRIKSELGVQLQFPTYREGLQQLLELELG